MGRGRTSGGTGMSQRRLWAIVWNALFPPLPPPLPSTSNQPSARLWPWETSSEWALMWITLVVVVFPGSFVSWFWSHIDLFVCVCETGVYFHLFSSSTQKTITTTTTMSALSQDRSPPPTQALSSSLPPFPGTKQSLVLCFKIKK